MLSCLNLHVLMYLWSIGRGGIRPSNMLFQSKALIEISSHLYILNQAMRQKTQNKTIVFEEIILCAAILST